MKRGLGSLSVWASVFGLCLRASAVTDPFLQLSSPSLTNGQVQFTLWGECDVSYVVESSTNLQNWQPVATNWDTASKREIALPASNSPSFYRAGRKLLPAFPAGIVAKQNVNLYGNNVYVTSYDSADPAHDDPIHPNEMKAGGDIYCEGDIFATNAVIRGKVKTPGTLATSNAIIGDLTWTNWGSIQPGWYQDDYRFALPDVAPPFKTWNAMPGLTSSNTWHFTDGDYKYAGSLPFPNNGDKTFVVASGVVRLWVTGDFVVPGTWSMNVSNGATFKLYVGDVSGSPVRASFGAVNAGSATKAATFQYYGFPNNTILDWAGNDVYKGTVYAPQAVFTLNGGGNPAVAFDYIGACVVYKVFIYGHFNFHYDEDLKRIGPFR